MDRLVRSGPDALPGDTEATLRSVRRIARALALDGRELARRFGLTAPQLMCLRLLKDGEALCAGTIATALSLSPQTVTGLIDRLESRDLVVRSRSESDRRQVLVGLTPLGRETVVATAPTLQDRFVARLNALGPARRKVLRRALAAVVTLLEADELDAAPLLAHGHSLTQGERNDPASRAGAKDTNGPAAGRRAVSN